MAKKLNAKMYAEAKRLGSKWILGGECGHMWRVINQYMATYNGPAPEGMMDVPTSPITGTRFENARATKMVHIAEFTADLIHHNKLNLRPERNTGIITTFHDSCNPARAMGMLEEPRAVLRAVDLTVPDGGHIALMGPSGCGKTTLLRCIGGFEKPTGGEILYKGQNIIGLPPYKRAINTVFQRYALFPHLNVAQNVAFGPDLRKEDKKKTAEEVSRMLALVGLAGFEKRRISSLSGGQQQRVAIARALINKPDVLLLDEPLGALDLKLRREMQLELKRIQRESGITFIFVTHDQEEALTMSDRVAVMSAGHILQLGTPEDIYNEPQSAFVADFIGDSDIMAGTMVRDKLVRFLGCDFPCVDTGFGENADVDVVLRPEDVKLKPADDPVQGVPQGVVESLLFKGVHYEMKVRVGDSVLLVHSTHARPVGTQVKLTVAPEDIQVMRKSDYSPDILKRHAARV